MAEVAVIIPYYQVKPGLLRRAVQSVLRSCEPGRYHIVVVDDASPHPPRSEVEDLLRDGRSEITILSRENGGPAAARNTGIDHVVGKVEYICFLDSDDEFGADHLRRMMIAFAAGADFYFADTRREDESTTSFRVCDFPRGPVETLLANEGLQWYRGTLLGLTLGKNPFGTNSMAYRLAGQETVRFRPEYRRSCEDRLFAIELSPRIRSVAFSTHCDVTLGKGVNILASATWGTSAGLERMLDATRFHVCLDREFALSGAERATNTRRLHTCDRDFWESAIVNTIKSRRLPMDQIWNYLALRPRSPAMIPLSMMQLIRSKSLHALGRGQ